MNKTLGFLILTAIAVTVIPEVEAQYYSLYYPYYSYYPYSYYYYYPTYYALGKRSANEQNQKISHQQVVADQMTRLTRGTHQRVKK